MEKDKVKRIPILFAEKKNCCGCAACYAICPMGAIEMLADDEGFLYPHINDEKCVCCYQCETVCAFKSDQKNRGY